MGLLGVIAPANEGNLGGLRYDVKLSSQFIAEFVLPTGFASNGSDGINADAASRMLKLQLISMPRPKFENFVGKVNWGNEQWQVVTGYATAGSETLKFNEAMPSAAVSGGVNASTFGGGADKVLDSLQILYEWMNVAANRYTGQLGHMGDYKGYIHTKLLRFDDVVEHYFYNGVLPQTLDADALEVNQEGRILTCSFTFGYDKVYKVSIENGDTTKDITDKKASDARPTSPKEGG